MRRKSTIGGKLTKYALTAVMRRLRTDMLDVCPAE